jgi:streptogramin lyase
MKVHVSGGGTHWDGAMRDLAGLEREETKNTMRTCKAMGIGLATVALGACTTGRSDVASEDVGTGTADITVNLAPDSAACLQLSVSGTSTVTREFDLAPQESTTFFLGGLSLGQDTFTATAFGVACADAASASPRWLSDSVTATVVASPPVRVTLNMHSAVDGGPEGGAVVVVSFPASPTCAPAITEDPLPTADSDPFGVAAGPDGNLWFAEQAGNKIGVISPTGGAASIQEFAVPTAGGEPEGITAGPDGNLWFTEETGNKIGVISPTGKASIQEFAIPTAKSTPGAITTGPDGNLWFVEFGGNKVGVISPTGGAASIHEFAVPTAGGGPEGITAGPDGNLWFTEFGGNNIGVISPTGGTASIHEFAVPTANSTPGGITAGPDGNLWFTETSGNNIGVISPTGGAASIREFALPTANSAPLGITAGPDGNLWFVEFGSSKIGVISPTGGAASIQEFALPTANGAPVAITGGPDGNLWFTEDVGNKIGEITPFAVCSDAGAVLPPPAAGGDSGSGGIEASQPSLCSAPQSLCESADGGILYCADLATNPANCGGCGSACSLPEATATCVSGACAVGSCTIGFADCNGSATDGCEVDLNSDDSNCGSCGSTCAGVCASGSCCSASPSTTCTSPRGLGTLSVGGFTSVSATLPEEGAETWYSVTFLGSSNPSFHPRIEIEPESPSSVEFLFDVLSPGCGGAALACVVGPDICVSPTGSPATSLELVDWEVTNGDGGAPGSGGIVDIRVYRAPNTAADCSSFTLRISD